MNEIEADVAGTIVSIFPQNGQPVEFGEKLSRSSRAEATCSKVLVANRENRAPHHRGLQGAGSDGRRHSEADRDALHVRAADESVCIGLPAPSGSYLNITSLVAAAEITGAEAVHPGYGFLAENAHFAEILEEVGLKWIGPSPDAIRRMGDKSVAKSTVKEVGVPTVPGSPGPLDSIEDAMRLAGRIGYPLMVKAVAGGGGRGMRVARNDKELAAAFELATRGRARLRERKRLPRKYLAGRARRDQIFGDSHGRIVHLGERECSLQRRHQKILEESPSPALSDALRAKMGAAAVACAKAVNYVGAGTVEFLLDEDGSFFFMEMNTRLQVEHPVTEMVTGFDLVKEQIRVAAGEPLSFGPTPGDGDGAGWKPRGHAIEFRINAEDPVTFAPSPGTITTFHLPGGPGVRVDTAAYSGWKIPPFYDSLIAKLIVHGRDREEALARGRRALELFIVEGVKTTILLHLRLLTIPT